MPVLYAAIGGDSIIRFTSAGPMDTCSVDGTAAAKRQRFNIEASGRGLGTFPDEHYLTWPRPIPAALARTGLFLKNLNPVEELAIFLNTRGACLSHMGGLMNAINTPGCGQTLTDHRA